MIKKELHIKSGRSEDLKDEAGLSQDYYATNSLKLCKAIANDEAQKIRKVCPVLGECSLMAMTQVKTTATSNTGEDAATFIMKCKVTSDPDGCEERIDQGIRSAVQRTHEALDQAQAVLLEQINVAQQSFLDNS